MAFQRGGREPVRIVLPAAAPPASEVQVYVSGAVAVPGVYPLSPDDRVEDALRAAGGALPDADLERVNLAQRVHDGDQVQVPARGQPATAPVGGAMRINLNTASEAELDKLPGIGAVRAKRIVESRQQDGPFTDSVELVERRILSPALYQRVREQVFVR